MSNPLKTNSIYFFLPLFFVFLILGMDRLLTLKSIRRYTETRAEYYFYQVRERLLEENLREQRESPHRSTLFLLGTSHLGELSTEVMESMRPDLLPYNYSAPSAPFSYYAYIFSKAIDFGIRPKILVMEIFPYSASKEANSYALRYSYDWDFFYSEGSHFDGNERDIFLRSQVFQTQKFPFRISEAIRRIQDPSRVEVFDFLRDTIELSYKKNRGGIANNLIYQIPPEKLEADAEAYYKRTILPLQFSEEQFYFLERVFQKASFHQVPILLVQTLQHPTLFLKSRSAPYQKDWNFRISLFQKKYNFKILNFQDYEKDLDCKYFIDSHHLSGKCYTKPTEILLHNLP
jgi:hypothetical protein